MIKQHNVTGLKYLCITKKDDYKKYKGSGSLWTRHLKKYGRDITTTLLEETDSLEELSALGLYYSTLYDIVNNPEFANIIPETGYPNNCDNPLYNYSNPQKHKLYEHIALVHKKIWANKPQEEKDALRIKKQLAWKNKPQEEKDMFTEKLSSLWEDDENASSVDHVGFGYGDQRRKRYSDMVTSYWENLSEEDKKKHAVATSIGRLSMNEEAKAARREKIKEFWENNPELLEERRQKLSRERKGVDNPNARVVEYKGEKLLKKDFEKKYGRIEEFEGAPDFKKLYVETEKTYPVYECPHCGKQSSPNKKPSSFLKWHFDNCRYKDKES